MILKERLNSIRFFTIMTTVIYIIMLITNYFDPSTYQKYLGSESPLIFFIVFPVLGITLINVFNYDEYFGIYRGISGRSLLKVLLVPFLLSLIPIFIVDLPVSFAKDINVTFPLSLLFYPTIAFFVEMLFHVIPLMVLLLLFFKIFGSVNKNTLVLIFIIIVSLAEPLFQADFMLQDGYFPIWATLVASLNIFIFNIYQLYIFKRYGFMIMFIVRLVYYLFWHIIWGSLRLELLF